MPHIRVSMAVTGLLMFDSEHDAVKQNDGTFREFHSVTLKRK